MLAWPLAGRMLVYVPLLVAARFVGEALRVPGEDLTTFWPPAGAALAVLLLEPRRLWGLHAAWFVVLDAGLGLAIADSAFTPGWSLYFAAVNAGEVLLAAWILARLGLLPLDPSRVRNSAHFAIGAAFLAPAPAALPAAAGVAHLSEQSFGRAWATWWLGDSLGILIVVPAVHGLLRGTQGAFLKTPAEGALFLFAFLTGALVCALASPESVEVLHLQHVAIPLIVWAALRFDWRLVAWTLLLTGVLIVWLSHQGESPLGAALTSHDQLVHSIQLYLAAVGIPSMLLGAYVVGLREEHAELVEEMARRERAERRRATLERALQDAQRTEVVARLAAGVAHDINNMLTVLSGHTEMLRLQHGDAPRSRASLDALAAAVSHATELAGSLLALSRSERAERTHLDLATLVRTTLPLLQQTVPERVNVSFEDPGGAVALLGNEALLRRVLVNLCRNAGDAMSPRGGTLRIALGPDPTEPEHRCLLSVSDEGAGMSEAVRQRIFEPFFSTKGGAGTGLGLSVVRSVTLAHGGQIDVRSVAGEGTTFTLTMPVLDDAERQLAPEQVPLGHGEVVVVLADDAAFRERATRALARYGFEGLEVESAARFLELLESGALCADVLVLGADSPEVGGAETLRRLRDRGHDTPALLVTREPEALRTPAAELDAGLLDPACSTLELVRAVLARSKGSRSAR